MHVLNCMYVVDKCLTYLKFPDLGPIFLICPNEFPNLYSLILSGYIPFLGYILRLIFKRYTARTSEF